MERARKRVAGGEDDESLKVKMKNKKKKRRSYTAR
jgi:hypothetical protein